MKLFLNYGTSQFITEELTLHPGKNEIEDGLYEAVKDHFWVKDLIKNGMLSEKIAKPVASITQESTPVEESPTTAVNIVRRGRKTAE